MNNKKREAVICPVCGKLYHEPPALSRKDHTTYICPECGTREALEDLNITIEEQERIIGMIYKYPEN